MRCKEAIKNYQRVTSIYKGLENKLFALDNLLSQGDLTLLDKLLAESKDTRQALSKAKAEIKHLESSFKFLTKQE